MVAQLEGLVDRIALLHQGQLLDEGPLEDVELRLGLDGRYALTGTGDVDADALTQHNEVELLSTSRRPNVDHDRAGNPKSVLESALEHHVNIASWAPTRPNLVEWLCAATGMSVDDISLDVATSALLPMKSLGVDESSDIKRIFNVARRIRRERLAGIRLKVMLPILVLFLQDLLGGFRTLTSSSGHQPSTAMEVLFYASLGVVFGATMCAVLMAFDGVSKDGPAACSRSCSPNPCREIINLRILFLVTRRSSCSLFMHFSLPV